MLIRAKPGQLVTASPEAGLPDEWERRGENVRIPRTMPPGRYEYGGCTVEVVSVKSR